MSIHREQLDTLFDQNGTITSKNSTHNFKAGLDYFINKKSTIGVMVNGTLSDNKIANYSRDTYFIYS